ncbi:vWA domain-containing protein [Paenibacillus jiagnxiensis]|uniref:vWA domain-containing protein n=1 Tax=Paenibacillus jiagnxiensis TaxID=3228926 RepID=UPI0033A9747A
MKRRIHTKTILLRPFFLFFAFSATFFSGAPEYASAAGNEAGYDAVFVVDTSYSMTESDPEGTAAEVINMFMDMSEASQTRVGFVAYNHRIVASQPLTSVSVTAHKAQIRQEIQRLTPSGYTDLGMGLRQGAKLLSNGTQEGRKPFLILLSDGETDFGSSSGARTKADSARDVSAVIKTAQKDGYPVYTIGLNHDGTVNREELERIAAQTGGSSYITSSADDLPEIFNQIFAAQIRSKLVPSAAISATGALQQVTVTIPDSSMEEASLILLSEHKLRETQLYYNSQNIRRYESDKYTILKIGQPEAGEVKLKLRGQPGDLIKINLLGSYDFEMRSSMTPVRAEGAGPSGQEGNGKTSEVLKGQKNRFEAYLEGKDGGEIKDTALYGPLKAELVITPAASGKTERVPMTYADGLFRTEYLFPETGKYTWQIQLDGPEFYRHSTAQPVNAINGAPAPVGDLNVSAVPEDGEIKLELGSYFKDPNNDRLVYTLADKKKTFPLGEPHISDEGALILSEPRAGKADLTLTATDPDGATATATLHISVRSGYTVLLWAVVVIAAVGVLAAVLYLLLRPKPQFSGRLEGLFLATASGEDIPVKSWPLTSFSGRRVTLAELFHTLPVYEPLPEAERIVFSAGKQGRLLVKHDTRCAVQHGKQPVPPGKKTALGYNEKLYITFEDGVTEIELRYKAIKPNTNIYTDHLTVKITS